MSLDYESHHAASRIANRNFDKEWFKRAIKLADRNGLLESTAAVIDYGCSACELIEIIKTRFGCYCIAADYPPEAVRYAKNLGFDSFQYDGNKPDSLPPEYENFFDIAFSTAHLEHITNLDSMFSIVYRSLKKDGGFVCTVPNSSSYKFWLTYIYEGTMLDEGHHYRHLNYAKIMQLIVMNGFDVVDELHYKNLSLLIRFLSTAMTALLKAFRPVASRIAGTKYFEKGFTYLPEFQTIDWGFLLKKDPGFPPIGINLHNLYKYKVDKSYIIDKIERQLIGAGWMSQQRFNNIKEQLKPH